MGVLTAKHHIGQCLVCINEFHNATDNQRDVSVAELSEPIRSLLQRVDSVLLLSEHLVWVSLR